MKTYVMCVLLLAVSVCALAGEETRMAAVVGPTNVPFRERIQKEPAGATARVCR